MILRLTPTGVCSLDFCLRGRMDPEGGRRWNKRQPTSSCNPSLIILYYSKGLLTMIRLFLLRSCFLSYSFFGHPVLLQISKHCFNMIYCGAILLSKQGKRVLTRDYFAQIYVLLQYLHAVSIARPMLNSASPEPVKRERTFH